MTYWRLKKLLDSRLIAANKIALSLASPLSNSVSNMWLVNRCCVQDQVNKEPVVFCIGLSKTGTTSLSKALNLIGYRCSHFPLGSLRYLDRNALLTKGLNIFGNSILSYPLGILNYRREEPFIDLSDFIEFDAFSDTPIALMYRKLDFKYINAKFILTERDIESWLVSCRKHMFRPYKSGRPKWWDDNEMGRWENHYSDIINRLNFDLYGCPFFDERLYREAYNRHVYEVKEYFNDREGDLLIMNIADGDGWGKLCGFLGKPLPTSPFPRENVTRSSRTTTGH